MISARELATLGEVPKVEGKRSMRGGTPVKKEEEEEGQEELKTTVKVPLKVGDYIRDKDDDSGRKRAKLKKDPIDRTCFRLTWMVDTEDEEWKKVRGEQDRTSPATLLTHQRTLHAYRYRSPRTRRSLC